MEERRRARVGTVSGLALLVGGTALAAVVEARRSPVAACGLGVLTVGLAHALLDEIRRQAGRGSPGGWAVPDTVNAVLLAVWTIGAAVGGTLLDVPVRVRLLSGLLAIGYAAAGIRFVWLRRRAVAASARAGAPYDDTASGLSCGTPTG